jgi:PAP2 superfamily
MRDDAAALRQLDRLIWLIIGSVAAIVLAAPLGSTFYIAWPSFTAQALAALALLAGAWFYSSRRGDLRLASGLECTGQVVVFAAVGAPLSYLAASANLPLWDATYDAFDRAIGLDWRALLGWMNAHPRLHSLFALSYLSFTVQATTTVLALAFSNRLLELRTFVLAFMFSALVCIAISTVMPGEGIWGYYKLSAADYPAIVPATREIHLPVIQGLRDGTWRSLVGLNAEGIIVFPSFHAALGVIFMVALWPVRLLCWVGVVVNGLMVLATPVDGGHYFADVVAGIVVAVLCLRAARAIAHRATSRRWPVMAAEVASPPIAPSCDGAPAIGAHGAQATTHSRVVAE